MGKIVAGVGEGFRTCPQCVSNLDCAPPAVFNKRRKSSKEVFCITSRLTLSLQSPVGIMGITAIHITRFYEDKCLKCFAC